MVYTNNEFLFTRQIMLPNKTKLLSSKHHKMVTIYFFPIGDQAFYLYVELQITYQS